MGRKKLTNERFQIRCHPKVIKEIRELAKEISEEFLKIKEQSKSKNNENI